MALVKEHYHLVDDAVRDRAPVVSAGLTGPEGPQGDPGADAVFTPAAFVDPQTATAEDIATALIDAGLMASS